VTLRRNAGKLAVNHLGPVDTASIVRRVGGAADRRRFDTDTHEEHAMPKYVLAYHGGGDVPQTQAEQDAVMAAWGAWFESLGDAVLDIGNPTGPAQTVAPDGATTDGGGPNPLTGYSLIEAANLDAAVSLAKGCPIFAANGSVEVAETIEM
jgi:hypothetical protein